MNILKNYKVKKTGSYEEYLAVDIRTEDTEVFADLPICIIPYNETFIEPVLIGRNEKGFGIVMEKEVLLQQLEQTQKIYFELDEHHQPVLVKHATKLFARLPIEDDPEKYIYDFRNGAIYIIDVKPTEEEVEEDPIEEVLE